MTNRILICVALMFIFALPAAAQSGTLDRIRQKGFISLGYVDGAAPFSFSGENKQPQGYSVDLCRQVAIGLREQLKLPKLETRWVELTVQNRLDAVGSGRVDIECSTTTWTLSRQQQVDFSLITFVDGGSVLTKSGAGIGRLLDLDGKRVAVITGTTTEKVLRESFPRLSLKTDLVLVKSRAEGLKLLDESKVEGFASDRTTLIGLVMTGQASGPYRLLDEDFSIEPYALSLPRGDYEFRLAVNRVLARLFRTNEIAKIYEHWLGKLGPPSLLLSATYFVQGLAE